MNDGLPTSPDAGAALLRTHHEAAGGVVSGRGLEASIAGATLAVSRKTWLLPGRREAACALLRGCPADRLVEARPYRVVPPGSSPSARALEAVGMALAGDAALTWLGTGSVAYGAFTEALSLAATHRAPVTFVVHWYTNEGPFARQLAVEPAALAQSFGLAAAIVPGAEAGPVFEAVKALAALGGPALVQVELSGKG